MFAFKWIIQALARENVTTLFGVPGYANSLLFIEASQSALVDPVLARHESSAAWLAIGYAEAGKPFGACTVTSGAGVTNSVSGVVAAYTNSVPLLIISGQVETLKFGRGGFQELTGKGPRGVDACEIFSSMTKYNKLILDCNDIPSSFYEAIHKMKSGRPGPAHLNIPIDVLKNKILNPTFTKPNFPSESVKNFEDVAKLLQVALLMASNPMLLIGKGCHLHQNELAEFIKRIKIPTATTIHAKSYIFQSDTHLGIIGISGSPRCNSYFEKSDLIICLGSSLSEFTTGGFSPIYSTKKMIRIDIDETEFENVPSHHNILMDIGKFLDVTKNVQFSSKSFGIPFEIPRKSEIAKINTSNDRITPVEIIDLIQRYAPLNTFFTADSGNNAVWVIHYLETKLNQSFFIDVNTGCMGSGVMTAVGINFADRSRPVVAICGDGGFLMNGLEIGTAVEHNLGVIWIVMNDHKLGMVVQGDENKYGATAGAEFEETNICKLAESLGATSKQISINHELIEFLKTHTWDFPVVLDVRFNDEYLPNVYTRTKKVDGEIFF